LRNQQSEAVLWISEASAQGSHSNTLTVDGGEYRAWANEL